MRLGRLNLAFSMNIAGVSGLIWLLVGCTTLGPQYIATGRAAYNKVINYTDDQQMLEAIVRTRYGETVSMLAVTNVTANIRFTAAAEAQFGRADRQLGGRRSRQVIAGRAAGAMPCHFRLASQSLVEMLPASESFP